MLSTTHQKKKKILKVAFSRKCIFKIFRKTAAIFSTSKILMFFSDHWTELKIPIFGKKLHHFEKYFGSFYEIVRLSGTAYHS